MTPLILAIAAGVVVVFGVGIVIAMRSRGEDEGARFRHVADITSTWSRQSGDSQTERPLPYPDSNAAQLRPDSESDATASGRAHTNRPPTKGR